VSGSSTSSSSLQSSRAGATSVLRLTHHVTSSNRPRDISDVTWLGAGRPVGPRRHDAVLTTWSPSTSLALLSTIAWRRRRHGTAGIWHDKRYIHTCCSETLQRLKRLWESHRRATRQRRLPYGITPCYLPPDTGELPHLNPSRTGRYLIFLTRRDRKPSFTLAAVYIPRWFNTWQQPNGESKSRDEGLQRDWMGWYVCCMHCGSIVNKAWQWIGRPLAT